jgi:hypothetical protein
MPVAPFHLDQQAVTTVEVNTRMAVAQKVGRMREWGSA